MRTDKRETLKIGYREFVVSFVKKIEEGAIGECEFPLGYKHSKGRIRIKKGQDDVEKANTALHEILHAICYTQGLGLEDKLEERVVNSLTNGLVDFIRENPRFFRLWLRLLDDR